MSVTTVNIVEDPDSPGEFLLDLGHDLCKDLGWKVGDTLEWKDNGDGSWMLTKSSSTQEN